ncbi:MAG: hypothetical protein COA50_00655 [Flavobacteriaceae bacterium]|nr:MAG: hypothetical protein COA50_00655 [Flavobacteriaceae bacterium]
MKNKILIMLYSALLVVACSSSDVSGGDDDNTAGNINSGGGGSIGGTATDGWLVPVAEVRDGGPGKDGIPSIDNPKFFTVNDVPAGSDDLLVIGLKVGDETRAYPHFILDWHEVVNDDVNGTSITVSLCPLTGTSMGWSRIMDGEETSFGVSGLLYNNNLILYDRATDSNWSQVGLKCINGDLIGEIPEVIPVLETTWEVWKSMYPDTKVMNADTGFSRNYGVYPYGDYKTNNSYLIFPLNPEDERLPSKERVHAIIDDEAAKAYQFNAFGNGNIIIDEVNGKDILLVGDGTTIVSFELEGNTNSLEFEYAFNGAEAFFSDNEGTVWNVFGEAISGPGQGNKLKSTVSFIAYWFSIGAFYPNAEIYN